MTAPPVVRREERPEGRRLVVDSRVFLGVVLSVLSLCVAALAAGAVVYVADRNDRREELNALACALRADAATSARVASERGLPGDGRIVVSKSGLAAAALAVAGSCPPEKEQ